MVLQSKQKLFHLDELRAGGVSPRNQLKNIDNPRAARFPIAAKPPFGKRNKKEFFRWKREHDIETETQSFYLHSPCLFAVCFVATFLRASEKKVERNPLFARAKKRNETDYSRCSQSLDREGSDRSRQARRPERREAEESEKLKNHQSAQAGFLHVINMAESPSNIRGTSLNVRPAAEQLFFFSYL